jgi:hypothetical protein
VVIVVPSPPAKAVAAPVPPKPAASAPAAAAGEGTAATPTPPTAESNIAAPTPPIIEGPTVTPTPSTVESTPVPPTPAPETFTVGVTDYTFNSVNAIFGRLLKTPDGHVVTQAYWNQKEDQSNDEVPYYEKGQ